MTAPRGDAWAYCICPPNGRVQDCPNDEHRAEWRRMDESIQAAVRRMADQVTAQRGELVRLHWQHPTIGQIAEVVCPRHDVEVRTALAVLGIGSLSSDGSVQVDGVDGPGEIPVCLRCQAHPAKLPRELLRQWFGDPS